ncbi:MAG TPA: hypothetical protein VMS74_14545 [Acidimicrobiia bacterium]|nr:hypothetical protein [Acidimicrobiia bacterium]
MPRNAPSRVLVVVLALVGACSSDAPSTTIPAETTTSIEATTTTPTTTSPTTTSPTTTTSTTQPVDDEGRAILDDGRPATWIGVTSDYEAVEVDTASGTVIRSLGQVATAEDVADAECSACVNAIDAAWRTFDGSHIVISECCEPAAGLIHVLEPSELPLEIARDSDDQRFFWSAAPAPASQTVAFLGYQLQIAALDDPRSDFTLELERFPISNAAWSPDGGTVRWLEDADGSVLLRTLVIASGEDTTVAMSELDGWALAGLASGSSGELLVVRARPDAAATSLLVFTPDGGLVDEVPIEPGARLGGFDPSGTFLIYTADDGVVRWSGDGTGGELGDGFVHASW